MCCTTYLSGALVPVGSFGLVVKKKEESGDQLLHSPIVSQAVPRTSRLPWGQTRPQQACDPWTAGTWTAGSQQPWIACPIRTGPAPADRWGWVFADWIRICRGMLRQSPRDWQPGCHAERFRAERTAKRCWHGYRPAHLWPRSRCRSCRAS